MLYIIIIIIVNFISKRGNFIKPTKNYKYQEIKSYFKSGDILLFSYNKHNNLLENLIYFMRTKLMGTLFGHVGIILKLNNNLYVLESVNSQHYALKNSKYINGKNSGPRIVRLDIILQKYNKYNKTQFGIKFIDKEIPPNKLYNQYLTYNNVDFPNWLIIVIIACFDTLFNCGDLLSKFIDKNKMMCSEFVHDILYKCGVLKEYPSKIFYPYTITSNTFNILSNNKYSDVNLFII
jgi:hypothetical protein